MTRSLCAFTTALVGAWARVGPAARRTAAPPEQLPAVEDTVHHAPLLQRLGR